MSVDHRFNAGILLRLQALSDKKDWAGMVTYLSGLSNSGFRTAGYLLCEKVLLTLGDDDFWSCFAVIVPENRKAYLTTFLKAAVVNYKRRTLTLSNPRFLSFIDGVVETGNVIDETKIIQSFLPVIECVEDINILFSAFKIDDPHCCISYLLKCNSIPCYYVLFHMLRKIDHEHSQLEDYCNQLIKKGDDRSFNLVSIVKCYFDLPRVSGLFSLKLNPYELSRLDSSYEDFQRIISCV